MRPRSSFKLGLPRARRVAQSPGRPWSPSVPGPAGLFDLGTQHKRDTPAVGERLAAFLGSWCILVWSFCGSYSPDQTNGTGISDLHCGHMKMRFSCHVTIPVPFVWSRFFRRSSQRPTSSSMCNKSEAAASSINKIQQVHHLPSGGRCLGTGHPPFSASSGGSSKPGVVTAPRERRCLSRRCLSRRPGERSTASWTGLAEARSLEPTGGQSVHTKDR